MFTSQKFYTIRSCRWPRGGMVDTMDLKSMPIFGVPVQVWSRLPMQRTRFFLRLFFCYCRNQVAMCRIGATNKKIFVGNGGFIINE